ncbi:MAG: L-arabinose ABC transporter ATP-binding protein AraG [Armatimonadetes bacterium 55-13]|nr:L-arabinose ABC transporter ATP-binding protein AraG [Armatimonadota bacterium]ODU53375.1 MAG: L-arabinose ABC transporter ATP-binding protein AraG [bacterium SCN 57-13]OJU65678.1 MAG: L-arabinose ABC transporter ATP-binding protein AraG [Armatimonadetes bacterium 55-13]
MPLLFDGIEKSFPGVRALGGVSFEAREGSVHALMGENGAGKSTLLKILSGAYRPDGGALVLDGKSLSYRNTQDALDAGIAVIYQELQLVPQLSVAENLFLGHMPTKLGWTDTKQLNAEAKRLLQLVGEDIRPETPIGRLPIAQRQMVEIAKALSRNAKVLAFDEPTSSLSSREVDRLFAVIKNLQAEGRIVLYVSHRMDEIFEICDAATVLRDGQHVQTFNSLPEITSDDLVRAMVGREVDTLNAYRDRPIGDTMLRVQDLEGPGLTEPANFEVKKGEIVGIFGLVGAGRTETLNLIAGTATARAGHVTVGDRSFKRLNPKTALKQGIGLCPEDRKKEGIVAIASVCDNINLGVRKSFIVHPKAERTYAQSRVEQLRVRTPSVEQKIGNLSGGNQQKAILGRVLGHNLRVLLLDEPTRGIDIGAKAEVHEIVRGLAENGVAVLVVSSEMPELLGLCDRILVMEGGRFRGELPHSQATQEKLLELALPTKS